jgi:hypothetical protein
MLHAITSAQRGDWEKFRSEATCDPSIQPEHEPLFIERAYMSIVYAAHASLTGQHREAVQASQYAAGRFLHPRYRKKVGLKHAAFAAGMQFACAVSYAAAEGEQYLPDPWPKDQKGRRASLFRVYLDDTMVSRNLALLVPALTKKREPYSLWGIMERLRDPVLDG